MEQGTESAFAGEDRARAGHGLIFGKFLPFHAGHKRLIEAALARCERVTVAVFSRSCEPIPGVLRARWIEEECPDVQIVHKQLNYPDPWDEESWAFWVAACRRAAPGLTHLFTGEEYGDELARRLGVEHVRIERSLLPVTGRAIRQDPIRHWESVPNAVRPWLARKVAVVGAESTGKTTLSERLAVHYHTTWVPEFGREYCESNDIHTLTQEDLLAIAARQCHTEDEMAIKSNGLLICDTDLMVTRAWCLHLCGELHPGIAALEEDRRYDLHLLTSLEVGWNNDGTRICGDPAVRAWFHDTFRQELEMRDAPWMELPGRAGDAFALARNAIDTLWPSVTALTSKGE